VRRCRSSARTLAPRRDSRRAASGGRAERADAQKPKSRMLFLAGACPARRAVGEAVGPGRGATFEVPRFPAEPPTRTLGISEARTVEIGSGVASGTAGFATGAVTAVSAGAGRAGASAAWTAGDFAEGRTAIGINAATIAAPSGTRSFGVSQRSARKRQRRKRRWSVVPRLDGKPP